MGQIIFLSHITDKALDFGVPADAERIDESLPARLRHAVSEAETADEALAVAIRELVAFLAILDRTVDKIADPQMQKRLHHQTQAARAALLKSSCEVSLQVRRLSMELMQVENRQQY